MQYLLHKDIYMPSYIKNVALNQQKLLRDCIVSQHFKNDHSIDNRDYKHNIDEDELINLVKELSHTQVVPFEVEVRLNKGKMIISKQVIRTAYSANTDISIVLSGNKIVTAWLNRIDDVHKTLNTDKYFCPQREVWEG